MGLDEKDFPAYPFAEFLQLILDVMPLLVELAVFLDQSEDLLIVRLSPLRLRSQELLHVSQLANYLRGLYLDILLVRLRGEG